MPVTEDWGLDNANLWVVCGEHGVKFRAFMSLCPECRYGDDFSDAKVKDALDVEVVPA